VSKQRWGHEEKSKGSKNFELKKNQCNDAQNQMKKTKTKREPKPNTRGHDRQFWKDNQMTKDQQTSTSDP
jgi:hypothetical protein